MHDKVAEFEQEKFTMQKEHSQNIQELLDETNERLKTIENEYLQKVESSVCCYGILGTEYTFKELFSGVF